MTVNPMLLRVLVIVLCGVILMWWALKRKTHLEQSKIKIERA